MHPVWILLLSLTCLFILLYTLSQYIVFSIAFRPDSPNIMTGSKLPPEYEELWLTASDKKKIHAYFIPGENNNVILYLHGNAGHIGRRLAAIAELRKSGCAVLAIEYHGYGNSEGTPSEINIYRDGEAALNFLYLRNYSDKQIIIYGRSLGTTVACELATKHHFAAMVLTTPLTCGKEFMAQTPFKFVSLFVGNPLRNINKIKCNKAPLLVIHGTEDTMIPHFMGLKIYEAAECDKKFLSLKGAGHDNLSSDFSEQYWPALRDYIRKNCSTTL